MAPVEESALKRLKAEQIVRRLISEGFEAYLVGGCVRDRLLGIEPPDYDIATSALPEKVQEIFNRTVAVGASFGVVMVMDGDHSFEVATFRADDRYIDGRRPLSVRFVTAREDVERRDFTINGLLYDINSNQVIDYVNGVSDIKSAIIRTIGEPSQRFTEDKLRLLRAIRFAARLSFTIEDSTWKAICSLSHLIEEVSIERIRDEIEKMITGPNPDRALELLHSSGLLKIILPEVERLIGVEQPPEFHPEGDVWKHTLIMLKSVREIAKENGEVDIAELAWSALLHDIGKPDTFRLESDRIRFNNHNTVGKAIGIRIMKRLKLPGRMIENVSEAIFCHMSFMNVPNMRINTLKKFVRRPTFQMEYLLHKLDCSSSHRDLSIADLLIKKITEIGEEKISPPPLITGKALLALGLSPGPLFKKILTEVEDQQLLENISTEEEALSFVRKNFIK